MLHTEELNIHIYTQNMNMDSLSLIGMGKSTIKKKSNANF